MTRISDARTKRAVAKSKNQIARAQNRAKVAEAKQAAKQAKADAKQAAKDAKNLSKAKTADAKSAAKNRHSLSDQELSARIDRLQNEKKLRELTDSEIQPGRAAVKSIASSAGKRMATAAVVGIGAAVAAGVSRQIADNARYSRDVKIAQAIKEGGKHLNMETLAKDHGVSKDVVDNIRRMGVKEAQGAVNWQTISEAFKNASGELTKKK